MIKKIKPGVSGPWYVHIPYLETTLLEYWEKQFLFLIESLEKCMRRSSLSKNVLDRNKVSYTIFLKNTWGLPIGLDKYKHQENHPKAIALQKN